MWSHLAKRTEYHLSNDTLHVIIGRFGTELRKRRYGTLRNDDGRVVYFSVLCISDTMEY